MGEDLYNFKPIEQLVFSDDFMFGAIMHEPKICKGVLELLLQIKIDHVEYPELQKTISPFYSKKGVRLDVYVAGTDKIFDVECQSYKVENIGRRCRYYQSMLDVDTLLKGSDYSELKESFIIFLCHDDPFGEGLPIYTFERKCREKESVELKDATHHLIFNCQAYESEKNQDIKDFLSFVRGNAATSDFTKEIENMVQTKKFENTFINEYLAINLHERDLRKRATEQGLQQGLQRGLQQGLQQGIQQGRQQGIQQGKLDTFVELVKSGLLPVAEAARRLEMTEADFTNLLK